MQKHLAILLQHWIFIELKFHTVLIGCLKKKFTEKYKLRSLTA